MKDNLIINIKINSVEDITNNFNDNKLSDELGKYIYDECLGTPLNKIPILNFNFKNLPKKEEQEKIVDMIRSYYGLEIKEEMMHIEYNNIRMSFLIVLGVIFILISNLLSSVFWLEEVLLIIGWVLIWEVVYDLVFEETKKRIKIKRFKKLTRCKINFKSER